MPYNVKFVKYCLIYLTDWLTHTQRARIIHTYKQCIQCVSKASIRGQNRDLENQITPADSNHAGTACRPSFLL